MNDENEYEQNENEGQQEVPAAPAWIVLAGGSVAGFDPSFPEIGKPIRYYWTETNQGGQSEAYRAYVVLKNDGNIVQEIYVDCSALGEGESANRETTFDAPVTAGIGYSIELYVDVDRNEPSEGTTYAYHAVTVDEPFGGQNDENEANENENDQQNQ